MSSVRKTLASGATLHNLTLVKTGELVAATRAIPLGMKRAPIERAAAHGHLWPVQVVGVRMAMLGCRLIGLDEPIGIDQIKKLILSMEVEKVNSDLAQRTRFSRSK